MFIVRIEFKRIQSFLFTSNKLKEMVGSNALLGDVIRRQLVDITRGLNEDATFSSFSKFILNPDDPLKIEHDFALANDEPQQLATHGILSRDGGHFYAQFSRSDVASEFTDLAIGCIETNLPGILAQVSVEELTEGAKSPTLVCVKQCGNKSSLNLPIFHPCDATKDGVAEFAQNYNNVTQYVSLASKTKRQFLKDEKRSTDIASMLMHRLATEMQATAANDLEELVSLSGQEKDYLALVALDGNNLGNRFADYRNSVSNDTDVICSEIVRQQVAEQFFYSSRTALRQATYQAIKEAKMPLHNGVLPFQLLMLGGDDLLLVCRAKYALPLVRFIEKHLTTQPLADGKPLTFAAGVVYASHKLPFFQLQKTADRLLESAKIHARQHENEVSTVDWTVVTQSWVDDPITKRRQEQMRKSNEGVELLSQKPYLVSAADSNVVTVDSILENSEAIYKKINEADIDEQAIARSQLRRLSEQLHKGKHEAQQAWRALPSLIKSVIPEALVGSEQTAPFAVVNDESQMLYLTYMEDLVELIEIGNLVKAQSTAGVK